MFATWRAALGTRHAMSITTGFGYGYSQFLIQPDSQTQRRAIAICPQDLVDLSPGAKTTMPIGRTFLKILFISSYILNLCSLRCFCYKGVRFFLDTPVRRRRACQLHMFQFEVLSHAKTEYMEKNEAPKVRRATGVRAPDEFWYLPKLPKSMLRQPCGRYVIVERNMRSE